MFCSLKTEYLDKKGMAMTKNYDISSKSDMRRLTRDIESQVKRTARDSLLANGTDTSCPHCGGTFHAQQGTCFCPHCRKTIEVNFDLSEL
jgi:hypothetical protein